QAISSTRTRLRPTVVANEAGHPLLLRTSRSGCDRTHRASPRRCAGVGGAGPSGVPVAVSFSPRVPRHGWRAATRADPPAPAGARGLETERHTTGEHRERVTWRL